MISPLFRIENRPTQRNSKVLVTRDQVGGNVQKVQTSSYKINKSGHLMYSMMIITNNVVSYI